MMGTLIRAVWSAGWAIFKAGATHRAARAALCAAAMLLCGHQAFLAIGGAPSGLMALVLASAAGLTVALFCNWIHRLPGSATTRTILAQVSLALILLAGPWLPSAWNVLLSLPGITSVTSPVWNAGATFATALILLGIPVSVGAALMLGTLHNPRPEFDATTGCGAATGIAISLVACAWLGAELVMVAAAVATIAGGLWTWIRGIAPADSSPMESHESPGLTIALSDTLLAAVLGGLVVCVLRVVHQLCLASVPALWSDLAVFVLGLGLGAEWRRRAAVGDSSASLVWCSLLAAVGAVTCLAGFSEGVHVSLWLNSHVDQPALLLASRAALAAVGLLPLGLAFGSMATPLSAADSGRTVRCLFAGLAGAFLISGCLAASASRLLIADGIEQLRQGISPIIWSCVPLAWLAVVACTIIGIARSSGSLRDRLNGLLPNRWVRLAVSALVTWLAIGSILSTRYDPALSARTLFSTRVFIAYRQGTDRSLLTQLDDGRLLSTIEGEQGALTLWRHGGHQVHIRENGVPRGIVSLDSDLYPQFSPEVLQTVFPLALHEKPQSVLVLGMGSGANLTAALEFPLLRCVCAEPNPALVQVVQALHDGHRSFDERLTVWPVDVASAVRGSTERFDVIVSNPGQPAQASSQPAFTPAFYRQAASRLTGEGIFCQWLQSVDLGPDPVRTIVASMQAAFPETLAVEIAHCEFLLLGTKSPKGLVRPELARRVQAAQVRRTLAGIGLDWSVLLDLPAYRTEELSAFVAERQASLPHLAGQPGALPFVLPVELLRWTPKQQELHVALAPRTGRLLNWMGNDAESPFLLRRLGEVVGQQKIKTTMMEQYWSYRQSLRQQVSSRPASLIQQASATSGDGLHHEDRRRLDYFKVLSRAAKSHSPDDIYHLVEFADPYDPLLSDFVHFEAAELHARSQPRNVAQELRHRLHSVYFASPLDTSIHSVVSTLKLLREHPDAEPNPRVRWDLTNALLQSLVGRWEARAGVPPQQTTALLLRDIDATLNAAAKSMAAMPDLTAEAGLPPEQWAIRRRVLEKSLLSPVQFYRTQVRKSQGDVKDAE